VDQLEIALVKASKARPLSPLEASINRWVMRAEREIRTRSRQSAEDVKAFLIRQDWSALPGIQKEPTAMLGVAGMAAAVAVFLLFGGWKPTTINAQTVPVAGQNSGTPLAAGNGSFSGFPSRPSGNSLDPIASHEVDLYGSSRVGDEKTQSPAPAEPPVVSPKVSSGTVKRSAAPIRPIRTDKRTAYPDAHSSTQLQTIASPVQQVMLTPADATSSSASESTINLSQANFVAEPAVARVNPPSPDKAGGNESKTPDSYLEVGSFKDETHANQAVDTLTQLGFHSYLVHKNLLWAQSYHVEVGPYTNQKDIAEARQSLSSHGFKAHPVN
jgi:cell division protein FtsN